MRLAPLGRTLRSLFRVLAISLPVMGLFVGTFLAAAVLLAGLCNTEITNPYSLLMATVCGLIAWLFIAVFHVRQEALALPFQDRKAFLGRLRAQLKDLGYCGRVREADLQVFRPSFQSLLFGGKIRLRLEEGLAHLEGPKVFLEILRKRLRVQNHLDKDLKTFWDAQRRRNERLLKRVQITMQVTGKPWQNVCRQISEVLDREGANVECEVSLRASSAEGIRERIVEGLIRDWLTEKGIPTLIMKERAPGREDRPGSDSCLEPPSRASCLADTAIMKRQSGVATLPAKALEMLGAAVPSPSASSGPALMVPQKLT